MLVEVFYYKIFSNLHELNQIKLFLLVYGHLRIENPSTNWSCSYWEVYVILLSFCPGLLDPGCFEWVSFCSLMQSFAHSLTHSRYQ